MRNVKSSAFIKWAVQQCASKNIYGASALCDGQRVTVAWKKYPTGKSIICVSRTPV